MGPSTNLIQHGCSSWPDGPTRVPDLLPVLTLGSPEEAAAVAVLAPKRDAYQCYDGSLRIRGLLAYSGLQSNAARQKNGRRPRRLDLKELSTVHFGI